MESGVAGNLQEVIEKSGNRIREFVANVDRFTATETVIHKSVNKWGLASRPVKFEFKYVVSMKKNRLGFLNVDEYRDTHYSAAQFPDGVATAGLPALALIFHPFSLQNFAASCEGSTRARAAHLANLLPSKDG